MQDTNTVQDTDTDGFLYIYNLSVSLSPLLIHRLVPIGSTEHPRDNKEMQGQGTTTNNYKGPQRTAMDYCKYVRSEQLEKEKK